MQKHPHRKLHPENAVGQRFAELLSPLSPADSSRSTQRHLLKLWLTDFRSWCWQVGIAQAQLQLPLPHRSLQVEELWTLSLRAGLETIHQSPGRSSWRRHNGNPGRATAPAQHRNETLPIGKRLIPCRGISSSFQSLLPRHQPQI